MYIITAALLMYPEQLIMKEIFLITHLMLYRMILLYLILWEVHHLQKNDGLVNAKAVVDYVTASSIVTAPDPRWRY